MGRERTTTHFQTNARASGVSKKHEKKKREAEPPRNEIRETSVTPLELSQLVPQHESSTQLPEPETEVIEPFKNMDSPTQMQMKASEGDFYDNIEKKDTTAKSETVQKQIMQTPTDKDFLDYFFEGTETLLCGKSVFVKSKKTRSNCDESENDITEEAETVNEHKSLMTSDDTNCAVVSDRQARDGSARRDILDTVFEGAESLLCLDDDDPKNCFRSPDRERQYVADEHGPFADALGPIPETKVLHTEELQLTEDHRSSGTRENPEVIDQCVADEHGPFADSLGSSPETKMLHTKELQPTADHGSFGTRDHPEVIDQGIATSASNGSSINRCVRPSLSVGAISGREHNDRVNSYPPKTETIETEDKEHISIIAVEGKDVVLPEFVQQSEITRIASRKPVISPNSSLLAHESPRDDLPCTEKSPASSGRTELVSKGLCTEYVTSNTEEHIFQHSRNLPEQGSPTTTEDKVISVIGVASLQSHQRSPSEKTSENVAKNAESRDILRDVVESTVEELGNTGSLPESGFAGTHENGVSSLKDGASLQAESTEDNLDTFDDGGENGETSVATDQATASQNEPHENVATLPEDQNDRVLDLDGEKEEVHASESEDATKSDHAVASNAPRGDELCEDISPEQPGHTELLQELASDTERNSTENKDGPIRVVLPSDSSQRTSERGPETLFSPAESTLVFDFSRSEDLLDVEDPGQVDETREDRDRQQDASVQSPDHQRRSIERDVAVALTLDDTEEMAFEMSGVPKIWVNSPTLSSQWDGRRADNHVTKRDFPN